jgi:hypothetical protein
MKRTITTILLLFSLVSMFVPLHLEPVARAANSKPPTRTATGSSFVPVPTPVTVTVTIASGSPTQILGYNIGDKVHVEATLNTSDVNENGEGEPLVLQASTGFSASVNAYAVTTPFDFTATGAGVLSGFIKGFDGDESATVQVTLNTNQQQRDKDAQKKAYERLVAQLNIAAGATGTIGAACQVATLFPPAAPEFAICAGIGGLITAGLVDISVILALRVLDPSDPNFMVIAQPVFPSLSLLVIPPGATPAQVKAFNAFNALLRNQEQAIGFARACNTAINRAQGAFDAGNTFWEGQQVQALNTYTSQLNSLLSAQIGLLSSLQSALLNIGGFPNLAVTPNTVLNFENGVLSNGLSPALVQALTQLGADSATISQIRNIVTVQDVNVVAASFPQPLTAPGMIDGLQRVSQSFVNIDNTNDFVTQHYRDFLTREPDPSGLAFWTNEINSCGATQSCLDGKHINVSAAFFLSIEFQQTGYLVERIYRTAYGNASGTSTLGGTHTITAPIVRFSEFLPDTLEIGQGVIIGQPGADQLLENNKQAFAAEFVQRSRFTSAYANTLTPAQFVDSLFAKTGVTPSAAERTAAINEFGTATTSGDVAARGRALRRVAENATFAQQEFNRAFVLMQYFGYLRRDLNATPDSDYSGYDFWLAKLTSFNGSFVNAEMVKAFLASGEYRKRFGP